MNISSSWLRSYLSGQSTDPLVISTTGSGGVTKSVEISAAALIAAANGTHEFLDAKSGESWSLLLPTNHIAGVNVLVRSILLETEIKKVSEKADYTSIVPTQLHQALNGDLKLLDHLKNCKAVLVGGARLPENLAKLAKSAGINFITTYGATETCGGCVYDGIPLTGVEMRIVNGIIEIRRAEMNSGNWIAMNDFGEINDGRLVVLGRTDDVIISGGENISLLKLEKFLESTYPNQNFLALSVDDEKWGQALALISESTFPKDINAKIVESLGKLYLPQFTKVVSQIPKIGIGKYDRISAAKLF